MRDTGNKNFRSRLIYRPKLFMYFEEKNSSSLFRLYIRVRQIDSYYFHYCHSDGFFEINAETVDFVWACKVIS